MSILNILGLQWLEVIISSPSSLASGVTPKVTHEPCTHHLLFIVPVAVFYDVHRILMGKGSESSIKYRKMMKISDSDEDLFDISAGPGCKCPSSFELMK
jgi:hypothetical protein